MSSKIVNFPQSGRDGLDGSGGGFSGNVVSLDAYRINREFPDRWQAYLRAHFGSIAEAALAFGVTERAARRWWDGAGTRGAYVVIALRTHPETAAAYLLGDVPLGQLGCAA